SQRFIHPTVNYCNR
ncbi:Inner membrane protein YhcB, partial [Haemophilus influenzae]